MKILSGRFLVCGNEICFVRRDFAVNAALAVIILCLPISFAIRIFPEALDFFDGKQIIFLLPALAYFLYWGLSTGCYLCLASCCPELPEKAKEESKIRQCGWEYVIG